jgi:hypothetical protein
MSKDPNLHREQVLINFAITCKFTTDGILGTLNFLSSVSLLEILPDRILNTGAEVARKNRSQYRFNAIQHANFGDVSLFASVITTNMADIPCRLAAGKTELKI